PFTEDSTEAYVKHRLRLAGCPKMPFAQDAIGAVHQQSGGSPRVINTLCDNALFEAFLARKNTIDADLVNQIGDNLAIGKKHIAEPPPAPPAGNGAARPSGPRPGLQPPAAGRRLDLAEIDRYLESLGKL
ncbi:MAG TPA: AAA family ATPase, partial [Myxococcales bacterium]|nr:AAA family ATPase [Myxococcales bacterium]